MIIKALCRYCYAISGLKILNEQQTFYEVECPSCKAKQIVWK